MNTVTVGRKVVLTQGLVKQFVNLAESRYIAKGVKDPTKSLAEWRDLYIRRFPHFYRRVGKLIARELKQFTALKTYTYDQWAIYMDGLNSAEIQGAIDSMKKNRLGILPPATPPNPNAPKHGVHCHEIDQAIGSTGANTNSNEVDHDPGTTITDAAPSGFTEIPGYWAKRETHVVDTDKQHQLQARLRQALMSVSQCRVTHEMEDGDLDNDRLVDIGSGTNLTGLFAKHTPGRRLSVAVQIYADISGSMANGNDARQLKLCVTLGSVLEKLKIPTQIIGYDDNNYLVKDWGTKVKQAMLWKMPLAQGGTDLPKALGEGFAELALRRETRKVACIISDGDIGTRSNAPLIALHDHISGETWQGREPATVALKTTFPDIETCFFGIGSMKIPDCAFDYKIAGLSLNIVEEVSNKVVNVIVGK